ncbi:MAG: LON peptidase substrate-binding domain-containing protein [Nitrospirae bacterium]|nr:LON peptidase substrate-binding domain-containing protein [Nitrospirota bacterium]
MALRIPKIIPLFPLPDLVFFPHANLPLHIFEPRYRAMVREALEGDRIIGMTLLRDGWEERYYDNTAPIHLTGCAGRITAVQSMEGGRFNITLFGLTRFTVRDQFSDRSYRQGWVEPFHDHAQPSAPLPADLKTELHGLLKAFGRMIGRASHIERFLKRVVEEHAFVNLCCSELPFTAIEKQLLLESADPIHQTKRLVELLRFAVESPTRKPAPAKNVGS